MFPLYSWSHIFSEKTDGQNAARNTGLPLQLLLHPPFHCLGSRTPAEPAGSSPHGGVMDFEPLICPCETFPRCRENEKLTEVLLGLEWVELCLLVQGNQA